MDYIMMAVLFDPVSLIAISDPYLNRDQEGHKTRPYRLHGTHVVLGSFLLNLTWLLPFTDMFRSFPKEEVSPGYIVMYLILLCDVLNSPLYGSLLPLLVHSVYERGSKDKTSNILD